MILASGMTEVGKGRLAFGWRRSLSGAENLIIIVPFALVVVLPLLEMILRRFHTGLSGSTMLVQNATLIIGMAGAAVAARDRLPQGPQVGPNGVAEWMPGRTIRRGIRTERTPHPTPEWSAP